MFAGRYGEALHTDDDDSQTVGQCLCGGGGAGEDGSRQQMHAQDIALFPFVGGLDSWSAREKNLARKSHMREKLESVESCLRQRTRRTRTGIQ